MAARLLLAVLLLAPSPALATWSIVAVDPATREVGIAGASCIGGVSIIGGLAPGRGAVAAQALSHTGGRDRAVARLAAGDPPHAIVGEIGSEEWDPTPWHRLGGAPMRQYAVVSLDGPRQATFTGDRTSEWAGAATAPGVAVTGNLLVGEEVVWRALERFRAPGDGCTPDLADRLVGALLAGSNAGGDRRCVPELAALSAFVRVAGPDDPPERPALDLGIEYDGPSELLLYPIRGIWPKRGSAGENPVLRLVERYREARPGACLPGG